MRIAKNAHQKLINDKTGILEQQGSKGGKKLKGDCTA